jgi:hypothetical protein
MEMAANFLSHKECQAWIEMLDRPSAQLLSNSMRVCRRITLTDEQAAKLLFDRALSTFPKLHQLMSDEYGNTWKPSGLGHIIRVCGYEAGGKFEKHVDDELQLNWEQCGLATFMVYLNSVPWEHEGATRFFNERGEVVRRIQPSEGTAICFPVHNVVHDGQPLLHGKKYILRTSVIYNLEHCKDEDKWKEIVAEQDLLNHPELSELELFKVEKELQAKVRAYKALE